MTKTRIASIARYVGAGALALGALGLYAPEVFANAKLFMSVGGSGVGYQNLNCQVVMGEAIGFDTGGAVDPVMASWGGSAVGLVGSGRPGNFYSVEFATNTNGGFGSYGPCPGVTGAWTSTTPNSCNVVSTPNQFPNCPGNYTMNISVFGMQN